MPLLAVGRYKKYIGARLSMLLYTGSFPFFLVCYGYLAILTMQHVDVLLLPVVGAVLNFFPVHVQVWWQGVSLLILAAKRANDVSVQEFVRDLFATTFSPHALVNATNSVTAGLGKLD